MSKVWIIGGVVLILVVGAYFIMTSNKTTPVDTTPTPSPRVETLIQTKVIPASPAASALKVTIDLAEQNQSSMSGTAVLTEKDGKTVVSIFMAGLTTPNPQPAHIHMGSCPNVGTVVYPLTNVVGGKSETTLNVTLAKLASQQPLGINVHKSIPESSVYVACGNLSLPIPN